MSIFLAISLLASTPIYGGGALIATEVIRAGDALSESNTESDGEGLTENDQALLGREVRRTVYKGAAIRATNTRARRLVLRNQTVTIKYQSRGLEITMTGRAMGEGGAGDPVSVMNVASRQLVQGEIMSEGWVLAR